MADPLDDLIDQALSGGGDEDGLKPAGHDPQTGQPLFLDPSSGTYMVRTFVNDAQGSRFELRPASSAVVQRTFGDTGGGGLTFEQQMALRQTPSVSFSTSQSLSDPRQLALQAQQLEEQIRQWNQTYALDLQQFTLQQDQLALQREQGHRAEALRLTEMASATQQRMFENQSRLAEMRQQVQMLNAQMQFQAQQAGMDRAFQAAQNAADRATQLLSLTEQMRSKNIDQQIEIAAQIADAAKEPVDIIKNIALIEEHGSIANAIAQGEDALTDVGLQPLARAMDAQDDAQAEGDRLNSQRDFLLGALGQAMSPTLGSEFFTGEAPQLPMPDLPEAPQFDLGGLFNAFLSGGGQTMTDPTQTAQQRTQEQISNQRFAQSDGNLQSYRQGAFSNTDTTELPDFVKRALSFEDGGVAPGMALVHDDELVVSPHPFLVLNEQQQKAMGVDDSKAPKAQTGGFFNSLINTDQARQRLLELFLQASQRFQQAAPGVQTFGGVPSPVGVSAPGTSRLLQGAAAGVAAGRGFDPETFQEEARAAAPQGVFNGIVRRTR